MLLLLQLQLCRAHVHEVVASVSPDQLPALRTTLCKLRQPHLPSDERAAVGVSRIEMMRLPVVSIMIHMANSELAPAAGAELHTHKAARCRGWHVVADGIIRLKQVIAIHSNTIKVSTTGSHITLRVC